MVCMQAKIAIILTSLAYLNPRELEANIVSTTLMSHLLL